MFRKNKRLLAVAVQVALATLAALWSAIFSKLNHPKPYFPYVYVAAVVILAGLAAYFTQVKPPRDLERPVLALLGILAEAPLKLGARLNIQPRINMMLVERKWTRLGRKRIRLVWGINMNNHPDVKFSCNHDQGVAGQALKNQRPVLDNCETQDKARFNFSPKQLEQTKHVTAVWSWPVYETDNKGEQTGRVVAIVNLDCTRPGAFKILTENSEPFERSLKKFCEVASTVI